VSEFDRYDLEASFYDVVFDKQDDIPLYREYSKMADGAVLECGCGTGRITIPLARMGFTIVGIDTNEKMLAIAGEKLAKESREVQRRVKLVKADMKDFEVEEIFSLCLIPFSTFLHMLTVEDQEACLRTINRHLKPKGRIIISVFNPDLDRPLGVVRLGQVKQASDETIMRFYTQEIDFSNQLTYGTYIYDFVKQDGKVRRLVVPYKIRYVFYAEMRSLLIRMGYEIENVYGDEQKTPFKPKSPLMVFVAVKKD